MSIDQLPSFNALLNLGSAVFLLLGLFFILKKKVALHKLSMGMAFFLSVGFLASYLYYHAQVGSKGFEKEGLIRPIYFFILITHSILAALNVPLILRTLYLALKDRTADHARLARWVWPSWMYVSVTGVIVYWLLYH